MLAEIWDWVKTLAISFVIVYLIQAFVFSLAIVNGSSMEPTLSNKQWLFSNKIIYHLSSPKVGDIVVLYNPDHSNNPEEKYYVKRVVGLSGDVIEITEGKLYRNGELVLEPYTDSIIEGEAKITVEVPQGMYYVMGDNRKLNRSNDSRNFGPIEKKEIVGRIDARLWPVNEIKLFKARVK